MAGAAADEVEAAGVTGRLSKAQRRVLSNQIRDAFLTGASLQVRRRWPGADQALARSAGHCAEAQQLLDGLAADLCRAALQADGASLSVAKLRACKPADQRLVLREWLRTRGFRMPSQAILARILQEALPARQDKTPRVAWREGEVRRYRDGLYLLPPPPAFDPKAALDWDGLGTLPLPGGNGTLEAIPGQAGGVDAALWARGKLSVRYRQGGEQCRLPGRHGSHDIKKLFQEQGVPPWLRERAPLLYLDGELAAVAGWWVCEPFAARVGTSGVALAWRPGWGGLGDHCGSGLQPATIKG